MMNMYRIFSVLLLCFSVSTYTGEKEKLEEMMKMFNEEFDQLTNSLLLIVFSF